MRLSKQLKTDWESEGMFDKRIRSLMKVLTAGIVSLTVFANSTVIADATEIPSLIPEHQSIETNNIEGWPQGVDIGCDTACLIDADTGAVLYNKGMNLRMYPASTTKVMTALVALENSSLDEIVTATETGAVEVYYSSANLGIMPGEQFTMEDCLYAVLMKSANDFASQVAEHVGGSVENFANMMNERAAEIGCLDTHFVNAHGMPDADHYTTAYDLVLIMQEAIKNEEFCKITGAVTHTIPATALSGERFFGSHNVLILDTALYYEGCLGGKTGFTDDSMYTFVTFAKRDGRTLICATMHADTQADGAQDAVTLLDYGFDNFQNIVMDEGQQLYSGGTVTVPATASALDVAMEEGEHFETDFGNMVTKNYTYHGYAVGSTQVTEESFEEEMATPTPTPEPEVTETEVEEDDTFTKEELKNIEPDVKGFNVEKLVTVPHIVIAILAVLIFIGIILIIVAARKKSRAKKKKHKKHLKKKHKKNSNKYK